MDLTAITNHVKDVTLKTADFIKTSAISGVVTTICGFTVGIITQLVQKQSFDTNLVLQSPLLKTALLVSVITVPLWPLFDEYVKPRMSGFLQHFRYEIATLTSSGFAIAFSGAPLTLPLAGVIAGTHLFWRLVAETNFGRKILGFNSAT